MRRIALLLGTFMLILGFSVLAPSSAQAYTCNNFVGETQDDGECPVHVDDQLAKLVDSNERLEDEVKSLQQMMLIFGIICATLYLQTPKSNVFSASRPSSKPKPRELQNN